MSTFGERVRNARKEIGLTQQELARLSGLSQATVGDIERGRNKGSTELVNLANALCVNPDWLKDGKGEKAALTARFSAKQQEPIYSNIGEKIALRGRVPIISYVQAGNWSEAMDMFVAGDADQWVETTYKTKRYTYALRVENDSMEPRFPAGAILIVEPEEEAKNGSFVIIRQNGSEATFKQLVIDGGQKFLKPLNDRYPIMPMRDDAVMCGVVKQMVMDV